MIDRDLPQTPKDAVGRWLKELDAAKQREQSFRETGQRILDLYDGTKAEETPFNILYSNTETLHPALYSTIPRPIVQRRFKDDDPLGKAAAQAGVRVLEFLLDTNLEAYDTYDRALQAATLDGLLPGRGWTSIKFDDEQGYEIVCPTLRRWNRVWVGYAPTWATVPWVAYEEYIDQPEAERLFGAEVAAQLQFAKEEPEADERGETKTPDQRHQGERKTCRIYQIWDKEGGRQVRYVSDTYTDQFLKEEDDPLELSGFFNCPMPLQFFQKTHSRVPTALYVVYEAQAKELNELTRRIKHITRSIKARGIYDSELGDDLKKLMESDDNELVPADKSSSLAAEKGLQNAIWFMPIEQLIQTLVQLYGAREQCKQVIYEITGISDIIRGASKASETLGAQEIKQQWGTLRLKRYQKEVARYARDLLRMTLELAASKFSEETWAKMTGLPFLLSTQFNELTAIQQALKQQVQMLPPPMPQGPGAPMPPPPPQVQQLQQIAQQLQAPQWSQVLGLLKTDLHRAYRIDIETNSTVEPEAAEDQKMIGEVLTAMSQVLNGIAPLVAKGVLPFEAAQVMLLTIIRRFRFGPELEDTIKAMQPPKQEDDGAEQAKAAQQALQLQQQQAESEIAFKQKEAEMGLKQQGLEQEMTFKQRELDLQMREAELKLDQEIFKMKQQAAQESLAVKAQGEGQKLDLKQKTAEMENKKFKTENVVNAKADQYTRGVKELEGLVATVTGAVSTLTGAVSALTGTVSTLATTTQEHETVLTGLVKAVKAPRRKKAIRGKDGRIEAMVEEVA